MEQIKRANKLFSNECIFLRNSLNIPVVSEKRFIFNGLSLESPDGDGEAALHEADTSHIVTQDIEGPSPPPSPPPEDSRLPQSQPEELSAKDFLHRLDLQIKQSKQAARRLKEEEVRWAAFSLFSVKSIQSPGSVPPKWFSHAYSYLVTCRHLSGVNSAAVRCCPETSLSLACLTLTYT